MIRPPVKIHGGKRYLARKIIAEFPPHRIYVEPFGGAASVLLNKDPVEVETYNDLDKRLSRLFRVLRDYGGEFVSHMILVPYSQVEFEAAVDYPPGASEVIKAACDFTRWRQSFGGQCQSWSFTKARARGGMAGDVNAWWTAIEGLPAVIDRLKRVQITCQSAFVTIPRFDHADALIYCDPPYVHSSRSTPCVYHYEMSDEEHVQLAELLHKCKAAVAVSGYESELYERLYGGWRKVVFEIANHAAGGKKKARMRECLWVNR